MDSDDRDGKPQRPKHGYSEWKRPEACGISEPRGLRTAWRPPCPLTPRGAESAGPWEVPYDVERYGQRPGPCVWAAEIGGAVVGLVGMVPSGAHTARIHYLHIEPDWQHTGILAGLFRRLCEHCHRQGYGRVALNSRIAPAWIWRLLVRCGFRLLRRIRGPRGEVLEFALDPLTESRSASPTGGKRAFPNSF